MPTQSVPAFVVGDQVKVGQSSTVFTIDRLEQRQDGAGEPYVMAFLSNANGTASRMEETSRLRRARS
jgi:hypothetical protein